MLEKYQTDKEDIFHEEEQVHRPTDCFRTAPDGNGHPGYRSLPQDWDFRADVFYNWKKRYGGLGVSEMRRMKQLEQENWELKKRVADLSLDKQMLQDVLTKNFKASQAPGISR